MLTNDLLARAGIHITPHEQAWGGWGWSIEVDELRHDWEGPYASPSDAAHAALTWLIQRAAQAIAWESYDRWAEKGEGHRAKPLLIDFMAEWCIPCREMDHTTYVHPSVVREADRFHMVKADVTPENDVTTELQQKYDVRGVPTVILLSSKGDETHRLVGYVGPEELLQAMRSVE